MKPLLINLIISLLLIIEVHPVFAQGSLDPDNNSNLNSWEYLAPAVDPLKGKFDSVSSIINELLPYLLTGAGLILFGMLLWGGFEMMTATTDAKKAEAGKGRITAAIVGFLIIFASYWIAQIIQIIFGVNILGG